MTKNEIIARIISLEKDLVALQLRLRELHVELSEYDEPDKRVAERYR